MTADDAIAAALFAVDPVGLGGVAVRAPAGPTRDEWLALVRRLQPDSSPWRRIPQAISDTALLGGLDLGATLNAGRPVAQAGLLAQADGGIAVLAMAERCSAGLAARLAQMLDTREVVLERDGLTLRRPARLGLVALDEGASEEEKLPAALLDRLAFHLQPETTLEDNERIEWHSGDIAAARQLLPQVVAPDEVTQALCNAALALGVASLRAPLLALRAARAAAALAGSAQVEPDHTALAARLVLAPRATQWPAEPAADQPEPEPPSDTEASPPDDHESSDRQPPPEAPEAQEQPEPATLQELSELVLAAARAAIPAGLLAALKVGKSASRAAAAGRSGALQKGSGRGRPIGARRGEPRAGARLNVIETLRAAAPWQRLRAQQILRRNETSNVGHAPPERETIRQRSARPAVRIHVRREDFHVTHFKQLGQTTTVFVVDASGSAALNRLAEAKGAVELLLADCYVRRDQVAVLAFRGRAAELLLPPTRSLARAKRSLAGLPGGGGTPLATGIDAARDLGEAIRRRGETPIVVFLTDGRANIARDGQPGRARASADALAAARQLRGSALTALLLDTSPQPQAHASDLAKAMGASYLPLPYAGAQTLSQAVRLATRSAP